MAVGRWGTGALGTRETSCLRVYSGLTLLAWHQLLGGHEFEQARRVGDGQGHLACCSPGAHKESDMTE